KRMAARFLQHLRVFVDLATDDEAKSRHEIAAKAPAADDDAKALPQHADRPVSGHILGGDDDQWRLPLRCGLMDQQATVARGRCHFAEDPRESVARFPLARSRRAGFRLRRNIGANRQISRALSNGSDTSSPATKNILLPLFRNI